MNSNAPNNICALLSQKAADYLRFAELSWRSGCAATATSLLFKSVRAELAIVSSQHGEYLALTKLFAFAKSDPKLDAFRSFIYDLAEEFDAQESISWRFSEFGLRFEEFHRNTLAFFTALQTIPNSHRC